MSLNTTMPSIVYSVFQYITVPFVGFRQQKLLIDKKYPWFLIYGVMWAFEMEQPGAGARLNSHLR